MMEISRFKLPIGLFIIIVLLSIGGYLILSPSEIENNKGNISEYKTDLELKDNNFEDNVVIESSEKEAKQTYNVFTEKLEKNAEVPFRVGQKLGYEFTGGEEGKDTYTVEKMERIDGKDNYVIRAETKGLIIISPEDISTFRAVTVYYYNKDTGEITMIKKGLEGEGIVKGDKAKLEVASDSIFAPWMLALDDNFKWKLNYNKTLEEEGTYLGEREFEVIEREKVNGRTCFKVELKKSRMDTMTNIKKIVERRYLWIDVEKRILVKRQIMYENIVISEKNLVSGL